MIAVCGANCSECELFKNKKCKGCNNTNGSPFGKKCWIYKYIEIGEKEKYNEMKESLLEEFNSLEIPGMTKIKELFPLHGSFVNLEYTLPNGKKVKLLNDNEIYLGNQVECEFCNEDTAKGFGLIGNMDFILICEYEMNGKNPEIILYKKR